MWKLITMAVDGVSVSASCAGSSLSGCCRRDLPRLASEAAAGAYVLDLEPVDPDAAVRQSLCGPLPDYDRDSGPRDAPDLDGYEHIVEAWGMRGVCLDRVPLTEYVAGWRALGARVGRVVGGGVVWAPSSAPDEAPPAPSSAPDEAPPAPSSAPDEATAASSSAPETPKINLDARARVRQSR